jgi:WD40 repeat protein/serine/threonine protein kinase
MSDESIFAAALGKAPGAERRAFLDEACGDDEALRRRIERLLEADDRTAGILERGPAGPTDPPPNGERPGDRVGPYKLLQLIGEGGMGVVYMAEQTEPVRRRVALKIIKPGMDSRQVLARFEAERQALALMDHQNIARVLDVGATESGRPYFVMELVHGVPITQFCDDNHLTPRERLALFVPVCRAIQHAHQKGIIHRDIKPSNVLVTMYDDKPVPKVIDFGVAKAIEQRLTERTMFTHFGALVGTFEYMSPEQAEMNAFGVDTRSDVYSLGVLLYELLTGTTPLGRERLRTAALHELVRLIKEEEAPRPSARLSSSDLLPKIAAARKTEPDRLPKLVRGELDWIVMRCLEKDRTRRYETASGLARDVEHYLADEPVEAGPPGASYRLRKAARKYRTPLRVAGAFLLLLVAGVVASTWQAIRATVAEQTARFSERAARLSEQVAQKRKDEADEAKQLAEERRDELAAVNDNLRRANYVADMNLARVAWGENNLSRAHELLEKYRPRPGEADRRGFEWHYLRRLFRRDRLTIKAHPGEVWAVAFTPDGKRLVTSGASGSSQPRRKIFDLAPGDVKFWDAATGQPLRVRLDGPADDVDRAVLSPDGTHLAATRGSGSPTVLVWDLATGGLVTLEGPATLRAHGVGFSPDGKRLVCAYRPDDDGPAKGSPRSIRIWDLVTRRAVVTIDRHPYTMTVAPFSPDGRLLAVNVDTMAHSMPLFKVWDAATGHEVFTCRYTPGLTMWAAAFSPDGKRLAACGTQGIRIWDLASRETPITWPSDSDFGNCLAFSPDGKRLAMGGVEGMAELWDTASGQKVQNFKGHFGPVHALAFSPDGTRLATGGADGTLRLWDTTAGSDAVSIPQDRPSPPEFPMLSPDGLTVLTDFASGAGRRARLWDTATGEPRCGPIELPQAVDSRAASSADGVVQYFQAAWTADGKRLYLPDSGKTIRVVDVASGKVIRTFPADVETKGQISFNYFMTLCPNERWCAQSCPGGTIQVRNAQTGALFRTLRGLGGVQRALVFSPDGTRLLGADTSGTLKIWDMATGREIAATKLTDVSILVAQFSADGKRLAVAGLLGRLVTGEVRILDAETARELWSLKGHTLVLQDVVFSPDGLRLATTSHDHTVRLWDLTAGQEILKLVNSGYVDRLRFASDGRRLIGASRDRWIRVWDATPLPE